MLAMREAIEGGEYEVFTRRVLAGEGP
jgi:hypothetical protein